MPTILIVRPPNQTLEDIAVCRQAGWHAVPFSPIVLQPHLETLTALKQHSTNMDAVFWVSPGAIEIAAPYFDFSDGLMHHIAVGQASRRKLEPFCANPVHAPQDGNDSEAVLRLPIWQQLQPGADILIIRGTGGRNYLAENLKKQGFNVHITEVYSRQRQMPDWSVFAQSPPQAAYITSAEAARALFELAPPKLAQPLRTLLYLTHHPRIAETLRTMGVQRIEIVRKLDMQTLTRCTEFL